ncbi:uncharacterized protein LOC134862417 isoform X2 [Eleginops maclovinus]|uniref:uncharacterized protein LOC134862417 isoform X2 n=1 Tax=Eleginops maclovinus TaxID=56733 RepID=UPI003080E598
MWSAFMNGSGIHGGGVAGGGVPSQGWEFVPCSRMDRPDRGRGKNRSPSRRISSPPTVFSHIYDSQFSATVEGGAGTQLEVLRGQMWPGPDAQQQQQPPQQTQQARLKKKLEDLKKRHVQDKEEWIREKESLLREVADIQGGENRRILLDLKTVLDEVQVEVKREEEKRSELQLQYTRDRCAWDLEKAELKCRIAQLEAREGAGSISGGGPRPVASGSVREQHGETSTLRREREEQRRLLEDTHSTAMDLRCRLEHNERDWVREKAELLERFDLERREWECQLKDMQRKIEELYCDVGTKREETRLDSGRQHDNDAVHRLSTRSTSTVSSMLSDSEALSSSSQSEPVTHPPLRSFSSNRNSGSEVVGRDGHHSSCLNADSLNKYIDAQYTQNDHSQPKLLEELRYRSNWHKDSDYHSKKAVDIMELDAMFPGSGVQQKNISNVTEGKVHVNPEESLHWAELSYGSEKKKNTTALNAALKEIARVSEELCSYQDEIRKKSGDKRTQSESLTLPEESEKLFGHDKTPLEVDDPPCDLGQIYDDFRALEKENWITMSPDNTWRADRGPSKSWRANSADPDSYRETQTSPGLLSEIDTEAPPIPSRISSWIQSSPTHPDTAHHLYIPESPMATIGKCQSPCVIVDKKCSSPSIVRKFEAMLQENEGKVLKDGVVESCAVPTNSERFMGCCHNRWSCDASKFTGNKLSTQGTVQKSFSEVNILTAGKDICPGNHKSPAPEMPTTVKELPLDLLFSSLEIPPAAPNLKGSRRNILLEQKTAEFNRTLFQAEMGRGVKEQHSLTAADVGRQPVFSPTCASNEILPPRETPGQPHCTGVTTMVMGMRPDVILSPSTSNATPQNPKVQPRQMRCSPEGQEDRMKQEIPSEPSSEQSKVREAATILSPATRSEVTHKVPTANSPSRKTHHKAATEPLFPEPANTQPRQNGDTHSSKNGNPHGAKSQSARGGVSLQTQPGQQAQPKPVPPSQSDSSRLGPRMMNDHPWKALTLAAYPRPEGSRSNYGAVERILKNYESAARAQLNQSQPNVKQDIEVDMLDMNPLHLPPTLRHTQTSHSSHTTHSQLSSHSTMCVEEVHLTVQAQEDFRWNT